MPKPARRVDFLAAGVASTFGAGLFTGLAPAASLAGQWLLLAFVAGAVVAYLTVLSTSERPLDTVPEPLRRLAFAAGALGRLAAAVAIAGTFGRYAVPSSPAFGALALVAVVTVLAVVTPRPPALLVRLAAVTVVGCLALVAAACFAIAPVAPAVDDGGSVLGFVACVGLLSVCFLGGAPGLRPVVDVQLPPMAGDPAEADGPGDGRESPVVGRRGDVPLAKGGRSPAGERADVRLPADGDLGGGVSEGDAGSAAGGERAGPSAGTGDSPAGGVGSAATGAGGAGSRAEGGLSAGGAGGAGSAADGSESGSVAGGHVSGTPVAARGSAEDGSSTGGWDEAGSSGGGRGDDSSAEGERGDGFLVGGRGVGSSGGRGGGGGGSVVGGGSGFRRRLGVVAVMGVVLVVCLAVGAGVLRQLGAARLAVSPVPLRDALAAADAAALGPLLVVGVGVATGFGLFGIVRGLVVGVSVPVVRVRVAGGLVVALGAVVVTPEAALAAAAVLLLGDGLLRVVAVRHRWFG